MSHFSQQNQNQNLWWMNPTTPKSEINQQMEEQAQTQAHHQEDDENQEEQMEHMFEKPLTPSDVGKLNRLVIPKQHAEKYLPLSRFDSVEKGLLLSFEDELRKQWRFRYSYWNSSQSYVLTKGWSRFVKEKQLDAGDVVSFERRGGQLCIRWRRRAAPMVQDSRLAELVGGSGWSGGGGGIYYSTPAAMGRYPSHHQPGPLLYQPDCLHAAAQPDVQKPVARNKKQVRLFGVNLDQPDEPETPGPDVSSFSSHGRTHFLYSQGHDLNHTIQQDFNFSREYHQTRNYLGGSGDVPI